MTDERFVYNADLRDRKRAAQGARAKKGNSRSCTLPSDALSASQKRKLNGSVESLEMNKPMVWSRLRALSPTLQFLYLDHLVNEHHARRVDLCDMLGVSTCTFWRMQQELPGELQFRGSPKKPAPEWERFMAAGYQHAPPAPPTRPQETAPSPEPSSVVSTPSVLSGSVTVHCTASAALSAILRLIDDPDREYTFTVSFSE